MSAEEFNALPLEARRFIETHAGCLSCGNTSQKLTKAYELYLINKKMSTYVLHGGGINYQQGGEKGVLYGLSPNDTDLEIREKLRIAAILQEKAPEVFISYDERGIEELIASLDEPKVINLDSDADAWAERSAILGIDTKTADYPTLQAYILAENVEAKGKKKKDLIEAIDAIDITDTSLE